MEKQHMVSIIMPTYNGQAIKEEVFNFSVEEQKQEQDLLRVLVHRIVFSAETINSLP